MLANPDDLMKGGDSLAFSADRRCHAGGFGTADLHRPRQARRHDHRARGRVRRRQDLRQHHAERRWRRHPRIAPRTPATRAVIRDIAACMGTVPDRSGKPGIDQAQADAFFAECAAFDEWHQQSDADRASILPAGDATAAAAEAVRAIRAKVDDYFGRCRLAAFDPRAAAAAEPEGRGLSRGDRAGPEHHGGRDRGVPARAGGGRQSPAAARPGSTRRTPRRSRRCTPRAVTPLLGDRNELSEADWLALLREAGTVRALGRGQAGRSVEPLGLARVRAILASGEGQTSPRSSRRTRRWSPRAAAIASVAERLALHKRDLYLLCTNFVSFRDFYDARRAGDLPGRDAASSTSAPAR